ncbi:MAG: hypothetical protein U9R74_00800 [Pseudomonadota bacterium]|nr:hypothetical protein [Pseudomonadota bacterium]
MEELALELDQAREEIRDKEAEVANLDQMIQDMLIASPNPYDGQGVNPPEDASGMRAPLGDQEAPLWSHLTEEAMDPDWANVQSDRLLGLINGESMNGSGLLDMQCGASICRIQTVHESEAGLASLLETLNAGWGVDVRHFVTSSPFEETGMNAVVYYSREGHRLPSSS